MEAGRERSLLEVVEVVVFVNGIGNGELWLIQ
jgi:hypothetical protein